MTLTKLPLQCPVCSEADEENLTLSRKEGMNMFVCTTCNSTITNIDLSERVFMLACTYKTPSLKDGTEDYKYN